MTLDRDEIKTKLSNPAKLLLGYMRATNIWDSRELASIFDMPLRTVQRLKSECAISGVISDHEQNANDATSAINGVEPAPQAPDMAFSEAPTAPDMASLARANKESLRDTLPSESEQESPKPPMGAFDDPVNHTGIVIAEGGSVRLVNGTRQFWLDKFDGDAKRLDLALLQVSIQPNSRVPVLAQIGRQLGRQAAEKHDRDVRYQSAAAANKPSPKKFVPSRW